MIKVGDNHWYGKTVPQNITFAAEMYAEAASKNDLPQVNLIHPRTLTLVLYRSSSVYTRRRSLFIFLTNLLQRTVTCDVILSLLKAQK